MIKSIKIINPLDETLELLLSEPEKSGFIIRSIEGLGPVKADVHMTELATLDGSIGNSARLETRNIVMSLMFLGTPTIEDTRLKSYRFWPIKQNITFEIETDNRHCYTVGRVESNVPTIFDEKEGCQISILCPSSYFQDMANTTVNFSSSISGFEFPFSNESILRTDANHITIIDKGPKIEFGSIQINTSGNVFYNGDSETGMTIEVHVTGTVQGFGIYRLDTNEKIQISDSKLTGLIGSGIIAGDLITINTSKGNKNIRLLRNGQYYNILNALEPPITWFMLRRGDNGFVFNADGNMNNLQYKISYRTLYEGV